jgi:hypothetical protein
VGERATDNAQVRGESRDTGDQCGYTFSSRFSLIQIPNLFSFVPQALSSFGFQFITEQFLPRKLLEGDWI